MKRAWIEFSVKIERQSGNRARFNDLSTFLSERSRLANSIFGRETFPSRVKIRKEIVYTVTTPAVQSNEVLKCVKYYCCEGPHRLTECNEFRKRTYENKCLVVKFKNLCFKCLIEKHFARDCKSKQNFYVDDCLLSVPKVAMAFKMVEGLTSILRKAGFKLTKWISNSQEIIDSIPEPERSKTLRVGALMGSINERVLGVMWDINSDGFRFDVCLPWTPRTKRGLLSTMNSLFDPLGFISPVIIEVKLLYRFVCAEKLGWDEDLPENDLLRWEKWLATLVYLKNILIPRCLGLQAFEDLPKSQLHYFVDASKLACGAVRYIRTITRNDVVCSLVMSKSHLVPKDEMSIPRLELMVEVTAVRMNLMLKRELGIESQSSIF